MICSTNKKYHGTVPGCALGVVNLYDIVPLQKKHLKDALMPPTTNTAGMYAWMLGDNRLIVPQPVKGKLSLWNYDGPIEFIPFEEWVCSDEDIETEGSWVQKYWGPYMV